MSVKVMGQVWDLDLPHNQLIILLAMADHADHDGGNVYPSIGLIAWKTGYSERTVQRVISTLIGDGILECVDDTSGYVRKYHIHADKGNQKKPYKPKNDQKYNPRQNVTPTPDTAMSPLLPTQLCHPTPDTAMSPESSIKPSIKPSSKGLTPSPIPSSHLVQVRLLIDSLGVLNSANDLELFLSDVDDYTYDQWSRGTDVFKARRKEKNEYLPYKYLVSCVKGEMNKDRQSELSDDDEISKPINTLFERKIPNNIN